MEEPPQRAFTLRPSSVYSFLMRHCMSSDTSSIKSPRLCKGLRCSRMLFWMDGLLFFTSTILLQCLWVCCWCWCWAWWWCVTQYAGSLAGGMGLLGVCWWLRFWDSYHEAGWFTGTSAVTGLACWDSEHKEHLQFSSFSKCVEVKVLLWGNAMLCPEVTHGLSTTASKHWKLCLWDVIVPSSKQSGIPMAKSFTLEGECQFPPTPLLLGSQSTYSTPTMFSEKKFIKKSNYFK